MTAPILEYVASESLARYGPVEPGLARKLQRNIRRKFRTRVEQHEILALVNHYKSVYAFAASILTQFLRRTARPYAHPDDVDMASFVAAIGERYSESATILEIVARSVVYDEYLS